MRNCDLPLLFQGNRNWSGVDYKENRIGSRSGRIFIPSFGRTQVFQSKISVREKNIFAFTKKKLKPQHFHILCCGIETKQCFYGTHSAYHREERKKTIRCRIFSHTCGQISPKTTTVTGIIIGLG